MKVVGVLGGGQLGRMMAIAAHNLGTVKVLPLDPGGVDSPAGQVCGEAVKGSFKDPESIRALAKQTDMLTVEIEHVNCDVLDELEAEGTVIHPSPKCIRIIQDKLKQKSHFQSFNVPLAPFKDTPNLAAVKAAGAEWGYPFMLKARKGGYDGKGNAVVESEEGIHAAFESLGGNECYAEKWCPYEKELAVMVVRGTNGNVVPYPVVEFTARDNICRTTMCPAQISAELRAAATTVASEAVACLPGVGIFGVELFAMPDGTVFLNEVAPRPHNSGHFTIEACGCSQFEAHMRAVAGLPLPKDTSLRVGASLMLNILGDNGGSMEATMVELNRLSDVAGAAPHWYGKGESRKGRKMAHVTFCAASEAALRSNLECVADILGDDAMPAATPVVSVIMGSDSDLPCMKAAVEVLQEFGVPHEVTIVSAHRTPERMFKYAKGAVSRGLKCIIAGAGGAAHLPGMVAAMTPLPVIGVPVKTSALSGVDSLYSIVQMPRGVPVATVAIGNAKNAGLLAVRMVGGCGSDAALVQKMVDFQNASTTEVEGKAARLDELGVEEYLAAKGAPQSTVVM